MDEFFGCHLSSGCSSEHTIGHEFRLKSELDLEHTGKSCFVSCHGQNHSIHSVFAKKGMLIAVVGNPFWKCNRLSKLAAADGCAAALFSEYSVRGDSSLESIFGQFSAAIVDNTNNRTILAIDRMGIGQLFYCQSADGSLYYSTSLEKLKESRPIDFRVSNQALLNYLYFHVVPSPMTVFEDVYKLEPGQNLVFDGNRTLISHYWEPRINFDFKSSETHLSESLAQCMKSAVSRSGVDARTGCFLSGGLDSSTVTGIAQELSQDRMEAFTIGFAETGYDEMDYARITARHFDVKIHEYYVTPEDIAGAVDTIATAFAEPFGNSSAIPTYFCARLAAEHDKNHLLAGDGGDELFAGNERYAKQAVFEYYQRIPPWLRKSFLQPSIDRPWLENVPGLRKVKRYIEQAMVDMPERLQTYNFLHINSPDQVFSRDFLGLVDPRGPIDQMETWYARSHGNDLITRMLLFDWKLTLADNDVRKVATMCELGGIRVSFPMLDDDLVELSTTIPTKLKIRPNQLRYFFKKSFSSYLAPQTLSKSKHGFGLPFGEWLKQSGNLRDVVMPSIRSLRNREIFRPEFIDDLLRRHEHEHAAYYGNIIWVLLMLERWLEENA